MLSAVSNLQEAVNTIIKILGLGAANLSENVAEGTNLHTVLCSGELINILIQLDHLRFSVSGTFRGGIEVLVRAKLALSEGVTLNLTVRSTDQDVAELITAAIG